MREGEREGEKEKGRGRESGREKAALLLHMVAPICLPLRTGVRQARKLGLCSHLHGDSAAYHSPFC